MFTDLDFQINKIKALVADSFEQVNQTILDCAVFSNISNSFSLINKHITANIGKQLRPLLLLLSANAIKESTNHKINDQNNNYIKLAAVTQLIHIASLLHDDVLDNSEMRRNKKTINADFGNKCAILAGDFLYSKIFNLIAKIDSQHNNKLIDLIADTSSFMVEGEILQLSEKYNFTINEERYLQIIIAKTARLFSTTMQLPATCSGSLYSTSLAECGLNLGIAYQLLDDIFDYYKLGNDITEGRITLPVIFLLNNADIYTKQNIINIIKKYSNMNHFKQSEQLRFLRNTMLNNGGFNYTFNLAKQYLIKAKSVINILVESKYKQGILQIIDCLLRLQLPKICNVQINLLSSYINCGV